MKLTSKENKSQGWKEGLAEVQRYAQKNMQEVERVLSDKVSRGEL